VENDSVDTGTTIAILLWLIGLPVLFAIINVLKGKYWFAVLGFFFGIFSLIGAIRLAKPNSRWAKRYSPEQMEEAKRRFPRQAAKVDPSWQPPAGHEDQHSTAITEWPEDDPSEWDKTTRRAYQKQYGKSPS
jgi:hypothetical protein